MFRILGENVKVHWVSDPVLTLDVLRNLKDRHGEELVVADVSKRKVLWYDPGNTRIDAAEPMFVFELPYFSIKVRSQHWFDFREEVRKHLADDTRCRTLYGGKFFKIHNENNVICLSPSEREFLVAEVIKNEEDCSHVSRNYWKHTGGAFHDEEAVEEYLLRQEGKIICLNDRR